MTQNKPGERGRAPRGSSDVPAAQPSDRPGGNSDQAVSPSASGSKYAGEPGPAGVRGENHMDPLKVDKDADPRKA
jgi:hypothetical protein